MSLDIAEANVNRNITLAGTSVAIFTFLLFFLYPRYLSGDINTVLFQFTSRLLCQSSSLWSSRVYTTTVPLLPCL